jgi:8-oxo-dGTP pyrophosphatase MutT (NUDIX family)
MSEPASAPVRTEAMPAAKPRDAATLLLMDTTGGRLRLLFGRRRKTQAFAPDMYVFPGGSVDVADSNLTPSVGLSPEDSARLLQKIEGPTGPTRALSYPLAAIRETFEETGLLLGRSCDRLPVPPSEGWRRFLGHGQEPDIGALTFIARAITPPGRTRRFDARFFCAPVSAVTVQTGVTDEEFVELVWATLDEARALNLHGMTREILDVLEARLDGRFMPKSGVPIPFYFDRDGQWCQEWI